MFYESGFNSWGPDMPAMCHLQTGEQKKNSSITQNNSPQPKKKQSGDCQSNFYSIMEFWGYVVYMCIFVCVHVSTCLVLGITSHMPDKYTIIIHEFHSKM